MSETNDIRRACYFAAGVGLACASLNLAQAEDQPEDKTAWKTSASTGVTLTRGNSETLLFHADATTEKKWSMNELSFGINGTYGENDGTKNAESFGAFGQYNRLFSERLLGYFRADGLHDAVADVEYRVALSPGVGYYFVKSDRLQIRGEVGPGVVFEKLGSTESAYYTLRVAENLQYKINDRARLWQSIEFLPKVDKFSNYVLSSEIGVETDITKKLSLRVFAQDTYRSDPAAGRKQNDLKLVAGVGYKF